MSVIGHTAMVLAAGYGQRMRPLTLTRPKPLVEVKGRALIDYGFDRLREAGVKKAVVNVHYLGHQIETWAARQTSPEIVISDERGEILDTGGGILKALGLLGGDPFFVINSDSFWIDEGIPALERLRAAWNDAAMDCLLLLCPLAATVGYDGTGDFVMAPDGRLARKAARPERRWPISAAIWCIPALFRPAAGKVLDEPPVGQGHCRRAAVRPRASGSMAPCRHAGGHSPRRARAGGLNGDERHPSAGVHHRTRPALPRNPGPRRAGWLSLCRWRQARPSRPSALDHSPAYPPRRPRTRGHVPRTLRRKRYPSPRIQPIGDIDEDLLDDGLADSSLETSLSVPGQLLLLVDLIDEWAAAHPDTPLAREIAAAPHQALGLAQSLAELLDTLGTEDIDPARLPELYGLEAARHREAILHFLTIARETYPQRLARENAASPQERRSRLLRREAARLARIATRRPFIAAGSTGSIPATAALLKSIAGLENGAVVLPGLDQVMDEPSWLAVEPTHPQYALKNLIGTLGIARRDVMELSGNPSASSPRRWLISEIMRPAGTSHLWRETLAGAAADIAAALDGVELVETRSLQEEALTAALILRRDAGHARPHRLPRHPRPAARPPGQGRALALEHRHR